LNLNTLILRSYGAARDVRRTVLRGAAALGDKQPVFLLGHMRSGSTLLTNLLRSHPEILGSHELWRTYANRGDLEHLAIDLRNLNPEKAATADFLVDKILHNQLIHDPRYVREHNVKCIFLTREPKASISSMASRLDRLPMYRRPDLAAQYYEFRLRRLAHFAVELDPSSALYVDYAEIVGRTDETLHRITDFLGLQTPLRPEYEVDDTTGVWGLGDGSEHIQAGRVIAAKTEYDVVVDDVWLDRARAAYDDVCAELLNLK
jgi:hypothetical protein